MSSPAGNSFVPIKPNPFTVGNAVRERSKFFGREAEFELIRKRFHDTERGALFILCGERRSGKTSILFQIQDCRLGPEFIPVLVDMQSMATTTETEFLNAVIEEIRVALAAGGHVIPPLPVASSGGIGVLQGFVRNVVQQNPSRKLVLLFDEYEWFETKIDSGALSAGILSTLAGLMEQHPVFLIFTGSQHLEQRKRDYWKVFLPKSTWKVISYLDRSDAINLIRRPVLGLVHYDDETVETIYRLTSGQAFYTQAVCQSLVDLLNEQQSNHATRARVLTVADGLANTPLPQMIFLWDSLDRDEKLLLSILAESLEDELSFAGISTLHKTLTRGKYALHLPHGRLASAAEKLFRAELLLKNDHRPPGYAFRMDLWRRWIARMHSVWQVMHEESIPVRVPGRARRLVASAALVAVLIVGATVAWRTLRASGERRADVSSEAGRLRSTDPTASPSMTSPPAVTTGSSPVATPGPATAESVFVTLQSGPGVRVTVNGRPWGRTLRRKLPKGSAQLRWEIPEIAAAVKEERVAVLNDTTIVAMFRGRLRVLPTPAEAAIFIDSVQGGEALLDYGRHQIMARRVGYHPIDSTIVLANEYQFVEFALNKIPPGALSVGRQEQGVSSLDSLQLDQGEIFRDVIMHPYDNLDPGAHVVRIWEAGQAIERTIEVRSGIRTYFDPVTNRRKDEAMP